MVNAVLDFDTTACCREFEDAVHTCTICFDDKKGRDCLKYVSESFCVVCVSVWQLYFPHPPLDQAHTHIHKHLFCALFLI